MTSPRLLAGIPRGPDSLLIQAAISPAEFARPAWKAWTQQRTIDQSNWAEVRMLPAIAARAQVLGLATTDLPRLDGIRRFVWSTTQKQLMAIRPAIELLATHRLAPMPLKGAAVICHGLASTAERYIRDVDILLPPENVGRALALLVADGWLNPSFRGEKHLPTPGQCGTHAIKLNGPGYGELDLHEFAIAPNRFPGLDRDLQTRAHPGKFLGIPCLLPSPTDLLLNVLEHSFRRDPDRVLDWSVDAARLVGSNMIDWPLFQRITLERYLAVPIEARLRYLREHCHLERIPLGVLDALAKPAENKLFVDEYLARQIEGLHLPGARTSVLKKAERIRATEIGCHSTDHPACHRLEEVREGKAWRVLHIPLSINQTKRVILKIRYGSDFPENIGCRVSLNCGAFRLHRYSARRGLIHSLWRRANACIALDPSWFAAQETDHLTLFLNFLSTDKKRDQYCGEPPFDANCQTSMGKSGELSITLTLTAIGRNSRSRLDLT